MPAEATYSVVIDLPLEQSWAKLRDLSQAHNYVPGLTRTEITTAAKEGVGASRRVYGRQSGMKVEMDETVVAWRDGSGFRIRLHKAEKSAPPFQDGWFDYALAAEGSKTRLTCTLGFTMPFGFIGRLLEMLLKPVITGNVRNVALGLKHWYETGTRPTAADRARLRKQP